MKNFQARLQGAPLGVLFAWFAGFYFIGTYGLALVQHQAALGLAAAVVHLGSALLFGGVMTAVFAWQRHRSGGVQTFVEMNKAIRTGIVPEDAEPVIWVPALERRRRQNARARWLNPIVFGLFTVLGIWLIAQQPTNAVPWLITAFFVGMAVFSVIQAGRMLRKLDLLRAQLRTAPADPGRHERTDESRG